ncbi:auxin-repressed 12.5 kDa protein-like [Cucurbita maxima]|uniref:Auxin-repressed 12.5 kDa protein-like n=1 Tax=Cucurbita maxima TaxID=3661 RepID=A0A6J1KV34_CUCMA|nr:auxin-repressed 12.5 kDa protein-like [Cucurbita maxima]
MVLLEKLWDDVVAGPQPDRGLGKLRKIKPLVVKDLDGEGSKYQSQISPATPVTPTTPFTAARKDNVWRSVFNPGRNFATKTIGAEVFDKAQPNSPTVYDWLYSGDTRSEHR